MASAKVPLWGWGLGGGWGGTGAPHAPPLSTLRTHPFWREVLPRVSGSQGIPTGWFPSLRCSHLSSLLGWWESGRKDPVLKLAALKASPLSPAVHPECSSVPREQLFPESWWYPAATQMSLNLAIPTEIVVFVFDLEHTDSDVYEWYFQACGINC